MEKSTRKVQMRTVESREKLLNASLKLFTEKGYYNTNTKEIAKVAGISVGNFYNYYKDKGDIYYELVEKYLDESKIAISDVLEHILENNLGEDEIIQFIVEYVDKQMERAIISDRFFTDLQVIAKDIENLSRILEEGNEQIVTILEEFLSKYPKVKKRASYKVMAMMSFTLANKISTSVIVTKGTEVYREYLDEMIAIILYYIFGIEWRRV
ncbi:TetR/AcrR family transcriptional regulator [Anaeromicropila herbilytica]|uniref:HTH tetR-type domain-containing protein n=1 Tax=Anaeromicropila herbilytica TaxID=2785025 RepID=A0A7R7EJ23_9FIRM|nr:TetR/AcrR family transcriptional regulator [Anaeromicropila herbilytica]BCN29342.1 hypothetical protein bsdtb5_06370 [Anaeromicropila herbilytica]